MKEFFYRLFALVFSLAGTFKKINPNLVALISPHNGSFNDSLGEIEKALRARGGFEFVRLSHGDFSGPRRAAVFFTKKAALLSQAKYVFLNDNFMPLGYLHFKPEAIVVQLWHAEGAFKKFGLDIELPPKTRRRELAGNSRLSCVICSSPELVPIYAGAFGIDESFVQPLGSPRADVLINEKNPQRFRAALEEKYPQCRGKKIVLYAPTFRDDPECDERFLSLFDFAGFNRRFGETHCLFVRLHPQIHSSCCIEGAVDVTDVKNVNELTLAADELITDYSSICMDFVLLGKPCFFFAPDLDSYCKKREFYFDYRSYVPGPACETSQELFDAMESKTTSDRAEDFCRLNLKSVDGKSLNRILDLIVEK